MIKLIHLNAAEYEQAVLDAGLALPVEQTAAWASYENTVPDRHFWGGFAIQRDDELAGFVSFIDYLTHGYHYLRSHHAPIYVGTPTPEQEREVLLGIAEEVHRRDRKVVFCRLAVAHDLDICEPVLSTVPYDTTVVVDLTGGEEAIIGRMKKRGRRDVRKALRESPIICTEETEAAGRDFSEFYEVMVETGERDGFSPAPKEDYENFIRKLGPEHVRVYAGRLEDGTLLNWGIDTISGEHAVHYYAAMRNGAGRQLVADKLLLFELCDLGEHGCTSMDLMGIGSEFSPSIMGLNTFKTKFAQDTVAVAPDRDLPIRRAFYKALQLGKAVRDRRRAQAEEDA